MMTAQTAKNAAQLPVPEAAPNELRRTLGLWQGVALYGGSVLGTGVLVLPAIAAQTAGPASVLAWIALGLLSFPLAVTYAALSQQRPDAGGFSDAIERAFGARWGAVAGWLFLAQVPSGTIIVALIAGEYAVTVVGGGRELATAIGCGLVVLAYGLNLAGLRVSASAQLGTLAAIAVGLLVIIAWAMPRVEPAAFTPFLSHGPRAVGTAAVQLFWAFVGWEAISPLAREFRDPRDIRRASLIAVVIVGLLYVALAVVVVGTHAYSAGKAEAPLVALAAEVFGGNAPRIVGVTGFLLCFIPLNAYLAGTSRLTFALGRRRQLPSWLGVNSPDGTPRRAIAALGVVALGAVAIAALLELHIADLLPISTSSFIATYVLSMAAAIKLLRGAGRVAAVVSFLACIAVLVFVGPFIAWIALVSVAALLYQWATGRRASRRS